MVPDCILSLLFVIQINEHLPGCLLYLDYHLHFGFLTGKGIEPALKRYLDPEGSFRSDTHTRRVLCVCYCSDKKQLWLGKVMVGPLQMAYLGCH